MVFNKIDLRKKIMSGYFLIFTLFYIFLPIYNISDANEKYVYILSFCTFLSLIFFGIGLKDTNFSDLKVKRVVLDFDFYYNLVMSLYVLTITTILATSSSIPIVAALQGGIQDVLIESREDFLKNRTGLESLLSYVITILDSSIVPFFILLSLEYKTKYRYYFIALFFLFSICFLEKAYFFRLGFPLFFYFLYKTKNKKRFFLFGSILIASIIILNFTLAKFDKFNDTSYESFFSLYYLPTNVFEAVVWRTFVIPVITSLDGLRIFFVQFNGEFLYGRTSSFLSAILGEERINIERIVYFEQYGGLGSGNANFCYVADAFINFGYMGVCFFSYIAGYLIKKAISTENICALAIMPFFILQLLSSSIIGNLFSNGYLFFFFIIIFFEFKKRK